MTLEEFNKKWDKEAYNELENSTDWENDYRKYIDDCFSMYETEGFHKTFYSEYIAYKKYNGKKFKVIGRCDETDFDLECLPAWSIEFESGEKFLAIPEEICLVEPRPAKYC